MRATDSKGSRNKHGRIALTTDVAVVRQALKGRNLLAPNGFDVRVDLANQDLYKPAMIGRIACEGRIVPVWTTSQLQPPDPESKWLTPQIRAA